MLHNLPFYCKNQYYHPNHGFEPATFLFTSKCANHSANWTWHDWIIHLVLDIGAILKTDKIYQRFELFELNGYHLADYMWSMETL